jgi:pyrroloquinoline quinone biosynthesis protein B
LLQVCEDGEVGAILSLESAVFRAFDTALLASLVLAWPATSASDALLPGEAEVDVPNVARGLPSRSSAVASVLGEVTPGEPPLVGTDGASRCAVELVVLGVSQDGGTPQIGRWEDPAWTDPTLQRLIVSLGLVDHRSGRRWLFEATPDIRRQTLALARVAGIRREGPIIDGVFLTHAHIGHYTGLMFLGHESAGARGVPVFVLPRFAEYLRTNGPWSQLVAYENIALNVLDAGIPVPLGQALEVTAFEVPHRQEYAEVAGYRIDGPAASALFIPDIDAWEQWDALGVRVEDQLREVDLAFLDATFYANGEIPGRDMSGFPHPFITHSMERFATLPDDERRKVHFIHFNHTNPVRRADSPESRAVRAAGYGLARRGDRHCLGVPVMP